MLPVTVKVGGRQQSQDVTLLGTYFNKALTLRQRRLHHRRADHASLVESRVRGDDAWPSERSLQNCGWPDDNSQNVLVGERLAAKLGKKPGDTIESWPAAN